jgi:hypothetical protein
MPITSPVAEWTQAQPEAQDLERVAPVEKGATSAALSSRGVDDVEVVCGVHAVTARPEPLGTQGGLARILAAMMRRPYEGPSHRERAQANADRLLETIRVLTAL